jgi:hypothetical protein
MPLTISKAKPMSVERISGLESRVDSVESIASDHGTRITGLENRLVDVRLGMAELHADLKANNLATEQIRASVASIESDSKEMIAVYRATPKMRDNVRWLAWLAGAAWAAVMAGATLYAALK